MLRLNKKYRFIVEDESSLEKRINLSTPFIWAILFMLGGILIIGILGFFVFASTPMKSLLPGYLKESERTATEEQHLRVDSLVKIYEINEAYISGILSALNPKTKEDSVNFSNNRYTSITLDSLLPPSDEEKQFMENVRESERYNITYTSPAAARTMLFGNVNKAAVITEDSKENYQAVIILPKGAPIASVAEGKIISVASSPRASGGYEVIIQHPKGFLSKSSHISNLIVRPGDRVAAGQIIASGTASNGMKDNHMIFELWHDGDPLIPSLYLKEGSVSP